MDRLYGIFDTGCSVPVAYFQIGLKQFICYSVCVKGRTLEAEKIFGSFKLYLELPEMFSKIMNFLCRKKCRDDQNFPHKSHLK